MMKVIFVFGNQPYCDAFRESCNTTLFQVIYISDEQVDKPNYAKAPQAIFREFQDMYSGSGQDIVAFINLARGSVVKGVENIAKTWELIKDAYPQLKSLPFIGPTYEAAQIFTHKNRMVQFFQQYGLDTPQTVPIPDEAGQVFFTGLTEGGFPFPAVIKATELSGGRGMTFVCSAAELAQVFSAMRAEGHKDLILSEFVAGLEVSFAVLRLGDTFLRLPACYKEPTSIDLNHPDNKVKMTGAFKKFGSVYETIETMMKQGDIYGSLYLEAILKPTISGKYEVKFLEGAARISGNSSIESAALRNFNFYKNIATWIATHQYKIDSEERLCLQYASYVHHGQEDIARLQEQPWIIEAKHEHMGALPFAHNERSRIRISFIGEDFQTAVERAEMISHILGDGEYANHIKNVFTLYQAQHPDLVDSAKWEALQLLSAPTR